MTEIKNISYHPQNYCMNFGHGFLRVQKSPMDEMISGIIVMKSGSFSST